MGDYCAYAYNIRLKQDTPIEVRNFAQEMMGLAGTDVSLVNVPRDFFKLLGDSARYHVAAFPLSEIISQVQSTFSSSCVYFKGWDEKTFGQDLDGYTHIKSKGSAKWHGENIGSILLFLEYLQPYMDMRGGSIIFRRIFEEGAVEDVVVYPPLAHMKVIFAKQAGYDHGDRYASTHPRNDGGEWEPPDVWSDLMATKERLAAERANAKAEEGGYGF